MLDVVSDAAMRDRKCLPLALCLAPLLRCRAPSPMHMRKRLCICLCAQWRRRRSSLLSGSFLQTSWLSKSPLSRSEVYVLQAKRPGASNPWDDTLLRPPPLACWRQVALLAHAEPQLRKSGPSTRSGCELLPFISLIR